ncbi:MAG: imidazoleglycerol-phosphate dehydratase HisB [Bradymonadia bacterium]
MNATNRMATVSRKTRETDIKTTVWLDEPQSTSIDTGIGFLDHMLEALSKHSNISLQLNCQGDLDVDGHHTSEDCALALGEAMDQALGDRIGIRRFGSAYVPMDEALARVVVDLSGRPFAVVNLGLKRERIGQMATENITHVFQSLAMALRASIHVDCLRGENDHHRSEAAFKALALALKEAVERTGSSDIPSTKGSL